MPKAKKLSEFEEGKISALYNQNFNFRHIADQIGRSDKVVRNYLNDPDNYGKNNINAGRPSVCSPREKRHIVCAASNSTISSAQIVLCSYRSFNVVALGI